MTGPHIVASIEARMGSSRLHGKVLLDIAGQPALSHQLARMRQAKHVNDIVLATSTNPKDDALVAWAEREQVSVFRGSEEDVLNRVVGALTQQQAEIAVPLCGDCPLIDPAVIDLSVELFLERGVDFVTNSLKPGIPQGQDVQVVRASDLAEIARTVSDPAVHEHTCLFLHEHPERFSTAHMKVPPEWYAPDTRLQMDYPEDLELIRGVYEQLLPTHGVNFGIADILDLLRANPEMAALNSACEERLPRQLPVAFT